MKARLDKDYGLIIEGKRVHVEISYNKEGACLTIDLTMGKRYFFKWLKLRGIVGRIADYFVGIRKIKIVTREGKLITVYSMDGAWGYDRVWGSGDYWERTDGIFWRNDDIGIRGMQLLT